MDENNNQNFDNQPYDDYLSADYSSKSSHRGNQTKLCRYCSSVMDAKATICPTCRKYQKDNTTLVFLIIVVPLIIYFAPDIYSIGKYIVRRLLTESNTKSAVVEEYPQSVTANPQADIIYSQQPSVRANTLIYNNNGIKIYYNGMSSSMIGVNIAFQVENNTNEKITVHVEDFSLNNYTFNVFCYIDAISGTLSNESIWIDSFEMNKNDLDYSKLNRCKLNFEISTESDILGKETEMIEFNLR